MRRWGWKVPVWLLVIAIIAGTVPGLSGSIMNRASAAADFAGGTGTKADPYQIATAEQLDRIRDYAEDEHYFALTADIDLAASYPDWEPIGSTESASMFHLNGNGHTISNVSINKPADSNVGLFAKIDEGQTITNLNIAVGRIVGSENVGGLAGRNAGMITNVTIGGASPSSDVEGKSKKIGGLVGHNEPSGIIRTSSSSVKMTAYQATSVTTNDRLIESVGGLAGVNEGEILESSSTSEFHLRGVSAVGGLVGTNDGIIFGSSASGSVIHNTTTYHGYDVAKAGGLVGVHGPTSNNALISFSYATGSLDIKKRDKTSQYLFISYIGGLVGLMEGGEISYSYARGNVTIDTNNQHYAGGLAGHVTAQYNSVTKVQRIAKIDNTYVTGVVTAVGYSSGSYAYHGALVGSYSRSTLQGVGYVNNNDDGAISCSYYPNTGIDTIGLQSGRTMEELKDPAQFNDWDFDSRWVIDPGVNDGHPVQRTGAVEVRLTSPATVESFINETHPYTARVFTLADDHASTALSWSVTGGAGVSIDQNGLVTVDEDAEDKRNTTYTVKAALQDKPGVFSTGSLSVTRPAVTNVSVTPYTLELAAGESLQLVPSVTAVGGASTDVTYTTNSANLTVDENGLMTALETAQPSSGYTVTVSSVFNPDITNTRPVNVRAPYIGSVAITNKYSYARILQGGTLAFEATVTKHGNIDDGVIWSTNSSEVTIDPDTGVLTASEDAEPGSQITVTVTSKANPFSRDTVTLRVQAVTGISFFAADYYALPGGTVNIFPSVTVVEYAPQSVTWEYDEDVVESVEGNNFTVKQMRHTGLIRLRHVLRLNQPCSPRQISKFMAMRQRSKLNRRRLPW